MDLFEELESMAVNAADDYDVEMEPSEREITRWQALFAYSYPEAVEQIKNQKSDYSRIRVSDDHWNTVRSQKEADGYSREAYEHWIMTGSQSKPFHDEPKSIQGSDSRAKSSYLIRLEGVLNTPQSIREAANLTSPPRIVHGTSEARDATSQTRDVDFCIIDGNAKQSIETWLSQQKSTFRPTFVRVSKAQKDFDPNSIHPTLGLESTLPQHRYPSEPGRCFDTQHRGSSSGKRSPVLQDEYPVWYFFYGTLADPAILARTLSLPEAEIPLLVPASISGGQIKTWNGKYNALVDGRSGDHVRGSAYQVTSKEREDDLRLYETDKYEVVRCRVRMAGGTVQGLTFRFVASL